jgi:hypothetical protein
MCQQMGRHLIGAGRPGAIVSLASTHGTVAFPRLDQHMIRVPAIEWAQHGQRDRTGHHPDPVAREMSSSEITAAPSGSDGRRRSRETPCAVGRRLR